MFSRRTGIPAAGVLTLSAIAFAAASAVASLPLPTTVTDFRQFGTSFNTSLQPFEPSSSCEICHGHYDVNQEPYRRWASSMMAQATRDPVFRAAFSIANQDLRDSGYLCLRCHAPGAWLAGLARPDGGLLDNSLGTGHPNV